MQRQSPPPEVGQALNGYLANRTTIGVKRDHISCAGGGLQVMDQYAKCRI